MPFSPEKVILEEVPERPKRWRLTHELVYTRPAAGDRPEQDYRAPSEETDLASVPQALTWLIPTYGQYTKAVIVHDRLVRQDEPSRFTSDEILRDGMKELGVPWLRRWLIWAAVSWLTVLVIVGVHARLPGSRPHLGLALAPLLAVWVGIFAFDGPTFGWWRLILALLALPVGAMLAAAFLEPAFEAHMGGKLLGMLGLTILGIPFAAVGFLALVALLFYLVLEADPKDAGKVWEARPASPRVQAALRRARKG